MWSAKYIITILIGLVAGLSVAEVGLRIVEKVQLGDRAKATTIIEAFRQKTGCPVIVNTSFNVRGEPIVCTPEDSYRCFMRTEMDYLVLETCVLDKKEQPEFEVKTDWRSQFALD